jgi:hypothetical protein
VGFLKLRKRIVFFSIFFNLSLEKKIKEIDEQNNEILLIRLSEKLKLMQKLINKKKVN